MFTRANAEPYDRPFGWLDIPRVLGLGALLLGFAALVVAALNTPAETPLFVKALGLASLCLTSAIASSLVVIAWRE